jgi:hypothetical protein
VDLGAQPAAGTSERVIGGLAAAGRAVIAPDGASPDRLPAPLTQDPRVRTLALPRPVGVDRVPSSVRRATSRLLKGEGLRAQVLGR